MACTCQPLLLRSHRGEQLRKRRRAAYDLGIGGNFQPSWPTAMTASVRLDTCNALRIAVTWFFTVGSAKLRTRQMALLLFPCIISDSTSTCRSVRPRSAGETVGRLATGGLSSRYLGDGSSRARISGGINAVGEHQLKRAYHHLAPTGCRNETARTEVEGPDNAVTVLLGRQHHHRNRRISLAQ